MAEPFDKIRGNSSTSGSSFGSTYETYRQTFSNIDNTYNQLGSSNIFSYASSQSESTTSKALRWTNFSLGALGSLTSIGTSIASAVMMGKAMRVGTQSRTSASSSASATQSAAVAEYVKMKDEELQAKKTELTGNVVKYSEAENDAKQRKADATVAAKQAKTDYDTANTAYQEARKEKANQDRIASQAGSSLTTAQSKQSTLAAKTAYKANATEEEKVNMRTQEQEAELRKLNGSADEEGSVAYFQKQKTDAEAESKRQEEIMKEQKAEREKQAKLQVDSESEAKTAQEDETRNKGLKEQAQADLNNVIAAISQKAQQAESNKDKKK